MLIVPFEVRTLASPLVAIVCDRQVKGVIGDIVSTLGFHCLMTAPFHFKKARLYSAFDFQA